MDSDWKERLLVERIILFDGECNFCNASIQFIMKRDRLAYFKFGFLQGQYGKALQKERKLLEVLDSLVYIEGEAIYTKSSAALRICRHLKGFWKIFFVFLVVPLPFRDAVYDFIARNRYKWFGKRDACMIPSPEQNKRFLP